MELFITIKDDDEDGKWFTASWWENIPYVNDPPAHEAKGSTPQGALAALVANIEVNEAMAAETGVDPAIVALEHGSYVCEGCGSTKIEAQAWAPMNGVLNLATVEFIDDGHTWCPGCNANDVGVDFVENFSEDGETA